MFLKVRGIGKIEDSTIEMRGITVIAGENNTGKSTFGKVLYCMFSTFCNADEKIYTAQASDIRSIFQRGLPRFRYRFLGENFIDDILSGQDLQESVNEVIKSYSSVNPKPDDNIVATLLENLKRSIMIEKHEVQKMIVTNCFKQEFSGKINHLNKPDAQGTISLVIKKNIIEVQIKSNECISFDDKVGILHDAIYIDTPFIMDDIKNFYPESFSVFYNMLNHRDDLLGRLIENESNSTVLEEVIIKKKINNLLFNIRSVIEGEFIEDENNLEFAEQNLKKPVPLTSVSAGTKMFLITTHSPYFLHAIEVYSSKHGIKEKLKCYLAESEGDISGVKDVTNNIDDVYKQLAVPFQKLEDELYHD